MIGAILGDIIGSRFEFHNYLGKDFELLTPRCEFTDDTVMTCAVAQALMDSKEDFSDLSEKTVAAMQRIGQQYPNCGYGTRFIRWMFADNPQPYNSCGNGSAMRVSPVGFVARDVEEAKRLSAAVTCISHNHPEGMKGAEVTAVAIVMARQGKSKEEIHEEMEKYYDLSTSVDAYRKEWGGNGKEICQVSLPQALACFFEGECSSEIDEIEAGLCIGSLLEFLVRAGKGLRNRAGADLLRNVIECLCSGACLIERLTHSAVLRTLTGK